MFLVNLEPLILDSLACLFIGVGGGFIFEADGFFINVYYFMFDYRIFIIDSFKGGLYGYFWNLDYVIFTVEPWLTSGLTTTGSLRFFA